MVSCLVHNIELLLPISKSPSHFHAELARQHARSSWSKLATLQTLQIKRTTALALPLNCLCPALSSFAAPPISASLDASASFHDPSPHHIPTVFLSRISFTFSAFFSAITLWSCLHTAPILQFISFRFLSEFVGLLILVGKSSAQVTPRRFFSRNIHRVVLQYFSQLSQTFTQRENLQARSDAMYWKVIRADPLSNTCKQVLEHVVSCDWHGVYWFGQRFQQI